MSSRRCSFFTKPVSGHLSIWDGNRKRDREDIYNWLFLGTIDTACLLSINKTDHFARGGLCKYQPVKHIVFKWQNSCVILLSGKFKSSVRIQFYSQTYMYVWHNFTFLKHCTYQCNYSNYIFWVQQNLRFSKTVCFLVQVCHYPKFSTRTVLDKEKWVNRDPLSESMLQLYSQIRIFTKAPCLTWTYSSSSL